MVDRVNQRYGITDEAISAEVARLLPSLLAWASADAETHRSAVLTDAEIAVRRPRLLQAKASAALEGLLPSVATEALQEAFLSLRWDDDRCRRYISHLADSGQLLSLE